MTITCRPRFIHPVLLLRDALGRFARLRMPKVLNIALRRPKRRLTLPVFIQLALF